MLAAPAPFFLGTVPGAPAPVFAAVANVDDTWAALVDPVPPDFLLPAACLATALGAGAAERKQPAVSLGRRLWAWYNGMRRITGLRDNLACGGWFVRHILHAAAESYRSAGIHMPDLLRAGWTDKDFGDAGLIDRRLATLRELGCTPDHVRHIDDDDLLGALVDSADAHELGVWLCHSKPSASALARILSETGKSGTQFGSHLERALLTARPTAAPRPRRAAAPRYSHQ